MKFANVGALYNFERDLSALEPSHELFVGGVATLVVRAAAQSMATWWISRPGFVFPKDGHAEPFRTLSPPVRR